MIGRDEAFFAELFGACTVMMETIHGLPQPVIAKVHGIATAAGCQLVAACDLAVAAEGARFGTPGRQDRPVLLDPDGSGLARRRAQAGDADAADGGADRRADGAGLGAGQPSGAADDLDGAVAELVEAIARSSSSTVATGKRAFYAQIDRPEHDAYEHCQAVMTENALDDDAQEGMSAFLDKRRPNWRQ